MASHDKYETPAERRARHALMPEDEKAILRAEIRQDSEALSRYIEKHGNPAEELRKLFGPAGFSSDE